MSGFILQLITFNGVIASWKEKEELPWPLENAFRVAMKTCLLQ
jgi:hypothetical protein